MATDAATRPAVESQGIETFLELEAKITRVADALRLAHDARERTESHLVQLQAAHDKLQHDHMQTALELAQLRKERTEVHQRLSRVLKQLDGVINES